MPDHRGPMALLFIGNSTCGTKYLKQGNKAQGNKNTPNDFIAPESFTK